MGSMTCHISRGDEMLKSGRTAKTISAPDGYPRRRRRKDSRIIRLMRFLLTAPRIFRLTLIPIRLTSRSFTRQISVNPWPCKRFPWLYTFSNSQPLRSWESLGNERSSKKQSRQTDVYDHALCAISGQHARRGCSYGYGIHGCGYA